jgi:LysR family glycine cleavage system transcriptional activator
MNPHPEAPTWSRWLTIARTIDPDLPDVNKAWDLSFREELHAIDAVVAGQGIAVCSDITVSDELRAGPWSGPMISLFRVTASIWSTCPITPNC